MAMSCAGIDLASGPIDPSDPAFGPTRRRPLSLHEALERTLVDSPAMLRGSATVDKAKAELLGAGGAFLPRVDLTAQLARYGNQGKQATLVGNSVVESETAFYGSYAALSASLNLYSGGRNLASYQAANSGLEAAREDQENLRLRLFTRTIEDYAALAKAQEEHASLRHQERLHAALVDTIESAYRRGMASRLDLSDVRLQLAERQQRTLQQTATLQARAGQLAVNLGLEVATGERLAAIGAIPEPPHLPADQVALDEDPAIAAHPALHAAQLRLEAAQNKVRAARGNYLPRLDLVGNYNWVGQDGAGPGSALGAIQPHSYTVGLAVQQRLAPFTGEDAALQAAQAELREAAAQYSEIRLGLWNAKRQALTEVAQARAALDIARTAERDAEEAQLLQQARLRHGRGSETDLTEAQVNAAQRRLERVFRETNYRLIGWAAFALLNPRSYVETLLDRSR